MSEQKAVRWESDADGVVVLTLDDPQQQANTMNLRYQASMDETLQRLETERDNITGVVLTIAAWVFSIAY